MLIRNTALWVPAGAGVTAPSLTGAAMLVAENSANDAANGGLYTPPAGTTTLVGVLCARVAFGVTITSLTMAWDSSSMTLRIPRQSSTQETWLVAAFSIDAPGTSEATLEYTANVSLRSHVLFAVPLQNVGGWGTAQGSYNAGGASSGAQAITTTQANSLLLGGFSVQNPDADGTFFAPLLSNTEEVEASSGTGSETQTAGVVNTLAAPTVGSYSISSDWDVSRAFAQGAVEVMGA